MPVQPAPLDNVHLPLAAEPHAPQDACAHLLALAWGEEENYQNLGDLGTSGIGRDMPLVRDVRVMGAIGIVELGVPFDLQAMRHAFIEAGVWIRPIGNVVYLTPAFTIDADDLARLTGAVVDVVGRITHG